VRERAPFFVKNVASALILGSLATASSLGKPTYLMALLRRGPGIVLAGYLLSSVRGPDGR